MQLLENEGDRDSIKCNEKREYKGTRAMKKARGSEKLRR